MIDKLFHLKQVQIEQEILQKQQTVNKIIEIDEQITQMRNDLQTVQVTPKGAIVDFQIIEIHKQTMKQKVIQLGYQKQRLQSQVDQHNTKIIQLQKESEQYEYILNEQKKEAYKEELKLEALIADEITQSKWARKND